MLPTPLAWRLARRLQESRSADDDADESDARWERLVRSWTQLQRQRERWLRTRGRLPAAAAVLRAAWVAQVRAFAREFEPVRSSVAAAPLVPPAIGDLFADLRQLEAEFEAVGVDWKAKVLRATTEAIALRGVALGPFAIELHWERRGEPRFEIVALQPHPAAGGKGVTHPHVRDRHLCLGDAAAPLRKALADGRLADAFVLVRSVLRTYNPASPYTPLAEWGGSPCAGCGCGLDADERWACGGCDADYCEGCSRGCGRCDAIRCPDCLDPCALCREDCCSACLDADAGGRALCPDCWVCCTDCGRRWPEDRLADGRCPDCPTPSEEEPDDDETDGEPGDDADDGDETDDGVEADVGDDAESAREGGLAGDARRTAGVPFPVSETEAAFAAMAHEAARTGPSP